MCVTENKEKKKKKKERKKDNQSRYIFEGKKEIAIFSSIKPSWGVTGFPPKSGSIWVFLARIPLLGYTGVPDSLRTGRQNQIAEDTPY